MYFMSINTQKKFLKSTYIKFKIIVKHKLLIYSNLNIL